MGDGDNDLKMLEMAGVGVVMENTDVPKLEEKADLKAPGHDHDGVARTIEKVLFSQKKSY